jgi:hypothetical protein
MWKTIIRVAGILLAMLVLVAASSACVGKPQPEYADLIMENILTSLNEGDYTRFSERFDETMKGALNEDHFVYLSAEIKSKIGDYVPESKEFFSAEERDEYIVVRYRTRFSEEAEDVIVTVSFQEIEGEVYVSGLWFMSPSLKSE